jgi:WhiB family transcriptional regulator, redox-sensing transcriptional regulator
VTEVDHRGKDASFFELAACQGCPPEWFFPEKGDQAASREGKRVCATCPVIRACEVYATTEPVEVHGTWFGQTEYERRTAKRRARRKAS